MNLPETKDAKVASSPRIEGQHKSTPESYGYLSAPLTGPIRPLSPDALSVLSADEYDQIQHDQHQFDGYDPRSERPEGWRSKMRHFWNRNYGLALMLLAQFFGTLMNVTTRLLEVEGNKGKGLHPFQILFARMSITVVLASLYMFYTSTPHFPFGLPEVRWLLAARGFGGFFGVFGMYYSLQYLPLSDATVITFLAPGLACWACSFLINEPFTRVERYGTLVSLVGVIFIARPTTFFKAFGNAPPASGTGDMVPSGDNTAAPVRDSPDAGDYNSVTAAQRLGAVGIALVGVLGTVCALTTIRWIGRRAHPLISVNYFATWCTFVSLIMQFVLPGVGFLLPADLKEWSYLIFLGVCGFIMQFLLAASLSYEKSSRATNLVYCQMLFALGFDKLIFGHLPSFLSMIGSSLILGAAIFVALQKKDPAAVKETAERSTLLGDEGSGQGTGHNRVDLERLPLQEEQLRAFR